MSKIAFIYPGQGAQKAGMGADFYEKSEIAKHIFDQAGEELDLDMEKLLQIQKGKEVVGAEAWKENILRYFPW